MINVIGLGYIGLPTALMFAAHKIPIVGTDINELLVNKLKNNEISFDEKGLNELFFQAKDYISFQTNYIKTNQYLVAVPTPVHKDTKKIDTSFILQAISKILEVCEKESIIIIESTIVPGTIDKVIIPFIENKGFKIGVDIHLVHAPERIIPGNMIHELRNNARVIGATDELTAIETKKLYQSFCKGNIILTSIKMAELSKVVENTYRDINIAYANDLVKICDKEGLDVNELIKIANEHPRVNILQPGPGVGGHCLAIDPWFLVGEYPKETKLIKAARITNDEMPQYVYDKLINIMEKEKINISQVGIYGLTYKENNNDTRESPSLKLLNILNTNKYTGYKIYDPYVKINENQETNFTQFLKKIKLLVILVSHKEIMNQTLNDVIIFDTKNSIKKAKYRL